VNRLRLIEAALAGLGIALILAALAADQGWWDHHFMPIFAIRPSTLVAAEQAVRGLIALAGAGLAFFLRRWIAALLNRATLGGMPGILVAVVLAPLAVELILRIHPPYPHDADRLQLEPRRRIDPRLGWAFVPARTVVAVEAGRRVAYSFDAAGHRESAPGAAVDVTRPALLFTGESIIVGYGLAYEETIPVRVGALLGIPSVNLAVSDYSNDQSYLKLAGELPHYGAPAAVVTLFMPSLFDRNLLDNRPFLAPGLLWQPAARHCRLTSLLHWIIPYRSLATVEQGIARTRDGLRALVDLAKSRGAVPLIVVPQFGPESATDEMLRRRILDDAKLPYVEVILDSSWRLPGDMHPNARGAEAIAMAIAARLGGRGTRLGTRE
jgi:hypothetical protein